jgi:hypothetical protein
MNIVLCVESTNQEYIQFFTAQPLAIFGAGYSEVAEQRGGPNTFAYPKRNDTLQ